MKQFVKMLFASCLGVAIAGLLLLFFFFSMLGSLVTSVSKQFGDSKTETAKVKKYSDRNVLLLDLSGTIGDTKDSDFYGNFPFGDDEDKAQSYALNDIIKAIKIATEDPEVDAIVLKLENAGMGYATAQELRNHLENFKASGKEILAYAERYGYNNYYVSSVADKIYLNPYGVVSVSGMSSTTLFYPGILKKVGVEMMVFKVGTFKGAVEPFTNTKLSDANRMQIQAFLDGIWQSTKAEIAESRQIHPDTIQMFADKGGFLNPADEALRISLVDSLIYGADFKEVVANQLYNDAEADVEYLSVSEVLAMQKKAKKGKGDVLVLFAEGDISDLASRGLPIPSMNSGKSINRTLIKKLRDAADNDDVKAVVLRVNSPGGDAFLSELIHHEVKRLKAKKPIVVSMGNLAASGGYYISCEASKIFAMPYTLTGSIGIYGLFPNFSGLAQKLDLTYDTVKTAQLADFGTPYRPLTAEEKEAMQRNIERGYDTFITRVAEGRSMTKAQVDSVGQGRVWLGATALEIGLVDALGDLSEAITEAARLADLGSDYSVSYEKKENNWLSDFLNLSMADIKGLIHYSFVLSPEEQLLRKHINKLRSRTGVMALPPYDLEACTPEVGQLRY